MRAGMRVCIPGSQRQPFSSSLLSPPAGSLDLCQFANWVRLSHLCPSLCVPRARVWLNSWVHSHLGLTLLPVTGIRTCFQAKSLNCKGFLNFQLYPGSQFYFLTCTGPVASVIIFFVHLTRLLCPGISSNASLDGASHQPFSSPQCLTCWQARI